MTGPVIAVIQARMSSSRLPGKVLLPLGSGDKPVLSWVTERAKLASLIDQVIVATSSDVTDDPIAEWASKSTTPVVRGSLDDVLARYLLAAATPRPGIVVRLTADCPLVDPAIVDLAVATLRATRSDYCSTSLDGRYPRGLDAEAVVTAALEVAGRDFHAPDEREHVTLGIYRRPDQFHCVPVPAPEWARAAELRLTVDEVDDYQFVTRLVDELGQPEARDFDVRRAIDLLRERPDLVRINAHVRHRTMR